MALNVPPGKQNIGNIPDENNYCFKCGGELEIVEDCSWDGDKLVDVSYLRCKKCGQKNNWSEKAKK